MLIVQKNVMYRCPFCGVQGRIRLDKKENPFWRCPCCMVMLFFKSELSQAGFLTLQGIVQKKPAQYREAVLKRLIHHQKADILAGTTGA